MASCMNCGQKFRLQQQDAFDSQQFCGLDCRATSFLRPKVPMSNQPFDNMQKEKDRFKNQIIDSDNMRQQQQV
jgi:hypothetical protein